MEPTFNNILWRQLGAAIDMLSNAVEACPEQVWSAPAREGHRHTEFWYIAFHTLFFLDLYLSGSLDGFAPPAPFGLEELDPAGIIPERPYTKHDLTKYVAHCREKCRSVIRGMNGHAAERRCHFDWLDISFGELQLVSLRHVQHHAGQLNLILRQTGNAPPRWVKAAE
ncbi:MAG TPA: DinB family protein [Bryobacteraceae bacterium]|jgi:hypothetical protein